MHDHDNDLIAALAEGAAVDEAAERDIAGCPECTAELATQRAALAAIADAPRPGLSMIESADLRRSVAAAVGVAPAAEEQPARRSWFGLAAAAAVVIALVAAAPLVNVLSTGRGDNAASATTSAPAERSAVDSDTADVEAGAPPETFAATTMPPATEAPAAASESDGTPWELSTLPQSRLVFPEVPELDPFLDEVPEGLDRDSFFYADRLETRALTDDEVSYYAQRYGALNDDKAAPCHLAGFEEPRRVITIGEGEFGNMRFFMFFVTDNNGDEFVVAIDAETCEVLGKVAA